MITNLRKKLDAALCASEGCQKCALSTTRTNVVSGGYRRDAHLLLLTDAPSFQDDQHGVLLIGLHGRVLDEALSHVGLTREEVFVTPVVRCTVPRKSIPYAAEIEACGTYLESVLSVLATEGELRAVIALGHVATQAMCDGVLRGERREDVRGSVFDRCFDAGGGGRAVRVMPTWHPREVLGDRRRLDEMKTHFSMVVSWLSATLEHGGVK